MATIRAVCTDCGDEVDLRPGQITLVVPDSPPDEPAAGSYGFTCPECERYVVKPADERAVGLLIAGGVEPSRVGGSVKTATRRPTHPESPPGGAPLTSDDLLDFHLQLARDGWFDDLLALTIRPY